MASERQSKRAAMPPEHVHQARKAKLIGLAAFFGATALVDFVLWRWVFGDPGGLRRMDILLGLAAVFFLLRWYIRARRAVDERAADATAVFVNETENIIWLRWATVAAAVLCIVAETKLGMRGFSWFPFTVFCLVMSVFMPIFATFPFSLADRDHSHARSLKRRYPGRRTRREREQSGGLFDNVAPERLDIVMTPTVALCGGLAFAMASGAFIASLLGLLVLTATHTSGVDVTWEVHFAAGWFATFAVAGVLAFVGDKALTIRERARAQWHDASDLARLQRDKQLPPIAELHSLRNEFTSKHTRYHRFVFVFLALLLPVCIYDVVHNDVWKYATGLKSIQHLVYLRSWATNGLWLLELPLAVALTWAIHHSHETRLLATYYSDKASTVGGRRSDRRRRRST